FSLLSAKMQSSTGTGAKKRRRHAPPPLPRPPTPTPITGSRFANIDQSNPVLTDVTYNGITVTITEYVQPKPQMVNVAVGTGEDKQGPKGSKMKKQKTSK